MHKSSMDSMEKFLQTLDQPKELQILDVGSCQTYSYHESYASLMSDKWKCTGLDIQEGRNVDITIKEPYSFPFADNFYDVVISGQVLEHVECPWLWIKELYRVLKKDGKICIIAPSQGEVHNTPDYWRILPMGMKSLLSNCGFKDIKISRNDNEPWKDCIGIAKK